MSAEKLNLDSLRIQRSVIPERRFPTVPILLGLIVAGALAWWFIAGRPEPPTEVKTATARVTSGQTSRTVLNASGYVTARRRATVSAKTTGKVMEVLIEEGMKVEEGQLLAKLDDGNVRASYNLATSQVAAANLAQQETRVGISEAEKVLDRTQHLKREGFATAADLDRDQAALDVLKARLLTQIQQEAVAKQEVKVWQEQLQDTLVRAPFSGVVVTKDAQPGEMISPVSAGGGFTRTGIGTIVDMSSLEIEIDVNESYINRVSAGQEVVATLDAYPEWPIPANVIAIVPTADRQKATVRVRIGFQQLDPRILPDMGLKVAFRDTETVAAKPTGVLVPAIAVRREGETDYVFVVQGELLERRAVTLGDPKDPDIVLLAASAKAERVVVDGPTTLTDGLKIKEVTQ